MNETHNLDQTDKRAGKRYLQLGLTLLMCSSGLLKRRCQLLGFSLQLVNQLQKATVSAQRHQSQAYQGYKAGGGSCSNTLYIR